MPTQLMDVQTIYHAIFHYWCLWIETYMLSGLNTRF